MSEGEPRPEGDEMVSTLRKTIDTRYAFRGTYDREPEGVCRVRILESAKRTPILIISELHENQSTSVTNMIEVVTAELLAKYLPHRFDALDDDPAWVIEHYQPADSTDHSSLARPSYDRVSFSRWTPQQVWLGGQPRISLGDPDWIRLPDDIVLLLIGSEAEDLVERGR